MWLLYSILLHLFISCYLVFYSYNYEIVNRYNNHYLINTNKHISISASYINKKIINKSQHNNIKINYSKNIAKKLKNQNNIANNNALSDSINSSVNNALINIRAEPILINHDHLKIDYPNKAKELMIEGVVSLILTISKDGLVIDAKVLSGPAFGLKDAALSLAKKMYFLPATDNEGNAIMAHIKHDVVFRLKNS